MAGGFLDDDLAIFFDTGDFGTDCIWDGRSIAGQFFQDPYEWDGVETVINRFEAPTAQLSGLRQGDIMKINGVSYEVRAFKRLNNITVVKLQ